MALIFRHLIVLAVALVTFSRASLCAQTPVRAKDERSFSVYAPVASPAWDKLYYLSDARNPVKLSFQHNRRSASIKLSPPTQSLVFAVENIDPVSRAKTYSPVAEVAWPDATQTALIVFTISSGATPQVQAAAYDDGRDSFPLRSVRFFNATGIPLLGKVANFQGEVPPGMSPPFKYKVASENPDIVGVFPLAFAINDPVAGSKLLFNGTGDAWPLGRSLIFILPPAPDSDDITLRVLADSPPPPPAR